MFEAVEHKHKVSKTEFDKIEPALRLKLLKLQADLRCADFPVIVLFGGVDGAGKGETVNLFNEWMDPRWIATRAYGFPSDEESERPDFWRFWRDLPPRGAIGLFLSAWYSRPLLQSVYGEIPKTEFDRRLEEIAAFENALADDGALVLKFWMHLSRKEQKKRLEDLEKDKDECWRVTKRDWEHWHLYERFVHQAERLILHTNQSHAPWHVMSGACPRARTLEVMETFHAVARERLAKNGKSSLRAAQRRGNPDWIASPSAFAGVRNDAKPVLSALDMTKTVSDEKYSKEIKKLRASLHYLCHKAKERGISTIVVFEGWDASGKGGAIRRLVTALDARDYAVIPVGVPTDEERAQHWLWRFWRHISRAGRVTFFDRSWYGRVLVERVEGFASPEEWQRAYTEINDFERQLTESGIVLVKFWLHITPEEQLSRFKVREKEPWKRWKLTTEDWRNREKWSAYEEAVEAMLAHTATPTAPWHLIEANCKRHARLKIFNVLCESIKSKIDEK